ncbi:ketopantoate reductase family protein [Roseovarius sp.]|uniref:ketopantoate reductase family protein n=1 Tax=Roseovarius sp. TaxID=1486281 RepID=UPI0035625091
MILGAGAMGSVYGAFLSRAGNDVWLLDRWAEHMDAIDRVGLNVTGASGDWQAFPRATTNAGDVGPCDLVIVAVKGPDLAEAMQTVPDLRGQDGAVLSIQNGLGAEQQLLGVVPKNAGFVGIAGGFGASIPEPGHVHHNGTELVSLAPLSKEVLPRAEAIAQVWTEAGFRAMAVTDAQRMIWSKLICNAAFSATCCVTGLRIGQVLQDDNAFSLAAKCATEATEVARALGVDLEIPDPPDYVRRFGERIPGAMPSLLLDRMAGRRGEIDFINGAVAAEARRASVPAPVNSALAELIRAMEAHDPRVKNCHIPEGSMAVS